MRRLLHLPPCTATSGLYLVLGLLPIDAVLARNTLTLFANIIRYPGTVEYQVIVRQLSVKDPSSHSWTTIVKSLLALYDLPSSYQLLHNPPPKLQWKKTLRRNIIARSIELLKRDASQKFSLRYLNLRACRSGHLHHVYGSANDSPRDILRACTKVRFLLGQYRLQADIAKQSGGSPLCIVCGCGPEDLYHLIFICDKLQDLYTRFLERTYALIQSPDIWKIILQSRENLIQLIMDCSEPTLCIPENQIHELETLTRHYLYAVHCRRATYYQVKNSP